MVPQGDRFLKMKDLKIKPPTWHYFWSIPKTFSKSLKWFSIIKPRIIKVGDVLLIAPAYPITWIEGGSKCHWAIIRIVAFVTGSKMMFLVTDSKEEPNVSCFIGSSSRFQELGFLSWKPCFDIHLKAVCSLLSITSFIDEPVSNTEWDGFSDSHMNSSCLPKVSFAYLIIMGVYTHSILFLIKSLFQSFISSSISTRCTLERTEISSGLCSLKISCWKLLILIRGLLFPSCFWVN